jgi:hypothetical protein
VSAAFRALAVAFLRASLIALVIALVLSLGALGFVLMLGSLLH